jgi:antitoxin MazE6
MKITISASNELLSAADALAKELGLSRSELCAVAVAEFLARHQPSEVTTRLDAVYATEPSRLDAGVLRMQFRSLKHNSS